MSKMLKVEAKLFYLDLKENPRGRYLKITEKSYGQRSTIIVPEQGVAWFTDMFTFYARGWGRDGEKTGEKERTPQQQTHKTTNTQVRTTRVSATCHVR
jgi:hypothetical protein